MYNYAKVLQQITKALEEVISEGGMAGISVNVIAQKTNVSKGFIYRNFGGVDGLVHYYVRKSQGFPHFMLDGVEQLELVGPYDTGRIGSEQMIRYFRQLRGSKATREVIKASLIGDESLTETLNQTQHSELTNLFQKLFLLKENDAPATLCILLGGLYYLTIMAHNNQRFMDIDLRSESGWQRVEKSIRLIFNQFNRSALLF